MDGGNRTEWLKDNKIKELTGIAGCQRMARNIVRREREEGGYHYKPGGKQKKPSASGVVRRLSAAPWARKFVRTTATALTCPPGRFSWVAQYRHPDLQNNGKRPTRSKSYPAGSGVPEHCAFQTTLKWLWDRHECCSAPAMPRPAWVVDALAFCVACENGQACSFMEVCARTS